MVIPSFFFSFFSAPSLRTRGESTMMTRTDLTQLVPRFVRSNVPAILHWVSLKCRWNVFNLNPIYWQFITEMQCNSQTISVKTLSESWLLTSSLAWPAIKSLNMFSLPTLVSLVLWDGRVQIREIISHNLHKTNSLSLLISFIKWLPSLPLSVWLFFLLRN